MSAIRDYLEEKSAAGPREWLRRSPRSTCPEILQAVREIVAAGEPGRTVYNDDVERFVNGRAGDLPPHKRHRLDRGPLLDQLGHECYLARAMYLNGLGVVLPTGPNELGWAMDDGD